MFKSGSDHVLKKTDMEMLTNENIVYCDEELVAAFKPRGYVSEAHAQNSFPDVLETLIDAGGNSNQLYPVHRLDKDTAGLIVYARTPGAAAGLSRAIQNGQFQKAYEALIHGIPDPSEGTLEDFLFKDSRTGKVYTVKKERRGVRKAVLRYKLIKTFNDKSEGGGTAGIGSPVSLVHIITETGRTHQIRVQFGSRKLPLLGDRRYGAGDNYPPVALCATELSFPHPLTGASMSFVIPFDYPEFDVLS